MSRRRPPYGRAFLHQTSSGIRVAVGEGAWTFALSRRQPCMVLPDDSQPSEFCWPSDGKPALIYERGSANDCRLLELAAALIRAGAPSVIAIRESLMHDDPRLYIDPEVIDGG